MNAIALFRENPYPTDEEIREYLAGNLCRCSGYEGQLRGIRNFLAPKKQKRRPLNEHRQQAVRKKDAMQLVTGQPGLCGRCDPAGLPGGQAAALAARQCHRRHQHRPCDEGAGMEAIFTWEDVPQDAPRYTQAGQTYPEPEPHDRLILIDRHVRFVGDVVAIVAGETKSAWIRP